MRGDALNYDEWARKAEDNRWSYKGLLPYFRRTEHHFDPRADPEQYGFDGPIYTTLVALSRRKFPLRDTILRAWKSLGLEEIPDGNNGHPQGIAELVESARDGLRQLTSVVYPLTGIQLLTETMVYRVILEDGNHGKLATGVELADKRQFHIKPGEEVILCGRTYRSPQILMLSGVGEKAELERLGISQQVDLPMVGKNLYDHQKICRYWKLRHPEKGLALGSPILHDPVFRKGFPTDWLSNMSVPSDGLKAATTKDEGKGVEDDHVLLKGPRTHLEMCVIYAAFEAEQIGLDIPVDGTTIMSFCMACLPTSIGRITLGSADPGAPPIIDPNFYATEADRFVMRHGWRVQSKLMLETAEGRALVKDEIRPEGHNCLHSDASDEEIDARIKIGASSPHHPAGSCSMGKVVDGSCKVYGVSSLRVVDASVIPVPLAAHYQIPVLALAEQAVDIIWNERTT